jgi:hypothetical protein
VVFKRLKSTPFAEGSSKSSKHRSPRGIIRYHACLPALFSRPAEHTSTPVARKLHGPKGPTTMRQLRAVLFSRAGDGRIAVEIEVAAILARTNDRVGERGGSQSRPAPDCRISTQDSSDSLERDFGSRHIRLLGVAALPRRPCGKWKSQQDCCGNLRLSHDHAAGLEHRCAKPRDASQQPVLTAFGFSRV